MVSCTRRFEFDAAHRLVDHESACRNLHGHRYAVEVDVTVEALDAIGRAVDFGELKRLVGTYLNETFDHAAILSEADTRLIGLCVEEGWRVHVMPCNPTAENLAIEIFAHSQDLMPDGARVAAIRVFETPNCWAEYRADRAQSERVR